MAKKKKEIQHIDLEQIKNPEFLKSLDKKEIKLLCEDIRHYLIDFCNAEISCFPSLVPRFLAKCTRSIWSIAVLRANSRVPFLAVETC